MASKSLTMLREGGREGGRGGGGGGREGGREGGRMRRKGGRER